MSRFVQTFDWYCIELGSYDLLMSKLATDLCFFFFGSIISQSFEDESGFSK